MERIELFEKMLKDIQSNYEQEKILMDELKAQGKDKTATYRQYMANRLMYGRVISLYRQYGFL